MPHINNKLNIENLKLTCLVLELEPANLNNGMI